MTQPQNISQKIEDNLKPVFNRGGGSKNAANRESAESQISEAKSSVKAATTENISSLNGLLTIDGVSLSAGDRILVKDQTTQSQNGIYIVNAGDWQRSNDANSNSKVRSGMNVFVRQGTENADSGWFLSTDGNIDLGTTSLFFKKITDNIDTEIIAGSGVKLDYDAQANTLTIRGTPSHFFTARDNQPPSTNFATLDTRNSILVLEFDAATEESAYFVGIIDEGWDLTNGINVRIYWMADTATSGSVRWGVQFEKTGTDLDSNSLDTDSQTNSAANVTSGIESIASIDVTNIDSLIAGDRYRLRIYRAASDAINDTMTGDAQLVAVEVRSAQ